MKVTIRIFVNPTRCDLFKGEPSPEAFEQWIISHGFYGCIEIYDPDTLAKVEKQIELLIPAEVDEETVWMVREVHPQMRKLIADNRDLIVRTLG